MIKVIFSDLDGTLLNTKKGISDNTKKFISELKDIRFVINTGRLPYNIDYLKDCVDISNTICGNGSLIKIDNKVVYDCHLSKEDVNTLMEYGEKHDMVPRLFLKSNIYITKKPKIATYVVPCFVTNEELKQIMEKEEVYKIGFLEDNKERLYQTIDFINNNTKEVKAEFSTERFLECFHRGTSKGAAIDKTCELLNIKKDEVLAIGDNENDLSMFNRGYHTACPSNACDKVKESVEYVSDLDCDHDSMIDIIKHFL